MSETPVSGNANANAERINTALVAFTGCIGESLDAICSYSLTFGEVYVPFAPDEPDEVDACQGENGDCSQAWVRVASVAPVPSAEQSFEYGECGVVMRLTLEVGVLRCYEIPEDGEAPTESEVLMYTMQSMEDMSRIYCAAMACEVWQQINTGTWQPDGLLGGQYGGIWTFTVDI